MADREFVQDKMYLKNTQDGSVHEYEPVLAKVHGFEAFVANPSHPPENTSDETAKNAAAAKAAAAKVEAAKK